MFPLTHNGIAPTNGPGQALGRGWALFFVSALAMLNAGSQAEVLEIRAEALDDWTIVVAEEAHEAEQYAAEELQRFLLDTTGAELPIISTTRSPDQQIRVGGSAALDGEDADDSLNEEAVLIEAGPRGITLSGGSPRGALFAVYHFAEQFLGVRFLTADHTHTPQIETLRVPLGDTVYEPPFAFRWSYYYELNEHPAFAARLRNNVIIHDERFGHSVDQPLISHSIHEFVPVEKYGADHPEYFALVDGERRLDAPRGEPQVCSTNPDVAAIITEAARAYLDETPQVATVSVSPNDHANHCECRNCSAVNEREDSIMGSHLHLVNKVARAIAESHPDRYVGTLAYWRTRRPPRRMRPLSNVRIQFCTFEACTRHAIDDPDCPRNVVVRRDLDDWLALTEEVWIWHYITNLRIMDLPFPSLNAIEPTLRYFRDRGVKGVFAQGNGRCPGGELADLRNYVTSRLLWNPDEDAKQLTSEFLELHYQAAAPAIQRYIDAVEAAADEAGAHPWCYVTAQETGLGGDTARLLWEHMESAKEQAASQEVRARVEKAALAARKGIVEWAGFWASDDDLFQWRYPSELAEVAAGYAEAAQGLGVTRSEEFTPIEFYLQQLEHAQAGIPLTRLESDEWRLIVVEEGLHTVADLTHRPTGTRLIHDMAGAGIEMERGTIRESLSGAGALESADAEVNDDGVTVRFSFADGAQLIRNITLTPDAVEFNGELFNNGADEGRYRIMARPRLSAVANDIHKSPPVRVAPDEPPQRFPGWYTLHAKRAEQGVETTPRRAEYLCFQQTEGPDTRLEWTRGQLRLEQLAWHSTLCEWLVRLTSPTLSLKPGGRFAYGYRLTVK